jgi:hypothetical protein
MRRGSGLVDMEDGIEGRRDHHNESTDAVDNRLVADAITEGLISVNVGDFVLEGDRTKSPR